MKIVVSASWLFVLILQVALTSFNNNKARIFGDWIGTPLSKMTGTSELIVYGKIEKVSDSTFFFKVIKKISGNEKEDIIEIIKATADPFASVKPAPYKASQCYLLFLESKKISAKKTWKIMGTMQEGQMPVVDNYIYFIDRYFEGIPLNKYNVNGVELNIQRFEYDTFSDAISNYKKYYRWSRAHDNKYLPEKIGKEDEVTQYKKKSFMHNFLVQETQAIIANK